MKKRSFLKFSLVLILGFALTFCLTGCGETPKGARELNSITLNEEQAQIH